MQAGGGELELLDPGAAIPALTYPPKLQVGYRPWLRENAESARISLAICSGGLMKRFIEEADRGQWTLLSIGAQN